MKLFNMPNDHLFQKQKIFLKICTNSIKMKFRKLKFSESINEAMILSMKRQKNIICYGLGVDDPKRIFNTTIKLKEMFGPKRVFDVPASENALTGIGIGSSLNGLRPVMVHQRLDFFLYAMDQLINNAASGHIFLEEAKHCL